MYKEVTYKTLKQRKRRVIIVVALCVLLAACLGAFYVMSMHNMREQGAASIRNAIMEGARQCCAIEGTYPPSLSYLEENYGLSVNKDDYVITYQVFAENVMPTVMVVPR